MRNIFKSLSSITAVLLSLPLLASTALAGEANATAAVNWSNWWSDLNQWTSTPTGQVVLRVLGALAILAVGWLLAKLLSWAVFKLLCSTTLDDKIAEKLGLTLLVSKEAQKANAMEKVVAKVVYTILMLLVVVGALQFTGLTQVASPLEGLLDSVFQAVPSIAKAALLLLVAYFGGVILRKLVTNGANNLRLDSRFAELTEGEEDENHKPFSENLGNVIFWLIMVFGLAGALDALQIDALSQPVSNAIKQVIDLLPALAKAALIVGAGYILGRIARTVVSNLAASVGVDKVPAKLKIEKVFEKQKPSQILGLIVFIFILLQVVVAGLNELGLETLSGPLTQMVAQFWLILPALVVAVLIVIIGVIVGRLLRGILESLLKSFGFDKLMDKLGFSAIANRSEHLNEPSEMLAYLVQIAVILLASAQALETLGLATWSLYLNTFLAYLLKNVSVAAIVIVVGFAVANYVRDAIVGASGEESHGVAMIARYAILVLAFTMAVHQLDIAQDFVLIVFGLLFGSLCLGIALAFGLGSRGVAEEIVRRQYAAAKGKFGGAAAEAASPAPADTKKK